MYAALDVLPAEEDTDDAYVSARQRTSAYVSIRQHTPDTYPDTALAVLAAEDTDEAREREEDEAREI